MEGHPPIQQQHSSGDEGLSAYQIHAAALYGSDAGSDGVQPALWVVIQDRQTLLRVPDVWGISQ